MPKRKREGDGSAEDAVAPAGAKAQRITFKLNQGAVKVGHAFKVAKGFERQKLGRRQKQAKQNSDAKAAERIENEIEALKTLDTTVAGKHHLYKSMFKIKAVAQSEDLGPIVSQLPPIPNDPASLNVVARLCNSNPVKDALPGVLEELQRAAGIAVERSAAGKKKRVRGKDLEEASKNDANVKRVVATRAPPVDEEDESMSGEGDAIADASGDSEDDFAGFDARIAPSDSGSDDEDEDGDIDISALERKLAREGHASKRPRYDPAADLSLSDASASASPSPEPQKAASSKQAAKPKASAFLSSLSLGGYISGGSDDSEPESDPDVAPTRKNRRGQRARQQIWEKKFGQKAKHLENGGKKANDRSAGWDMKRGATDGKRGGRGGSRGGGSGGGRGGRDSAGGAPRPAKKKHNDDAGPLHPSWEAAKKAKEAKEAKEKPVAFSGKKITFD